MSLSPAQIVGLRRRANAVSVTYDADAATLFAAMATDPGPTRKGLYNDLILGLKADSIWSKIDALFILAAHEETTALLNIKSRDYDASNVNSATFTANKGHTFSGTAHLSTGYDPSLGGSRVWALDSAHIYAYVNQVTVDDASSLATVGVTVTSGTGTWLRPRSASGAIESRVNSAGTGNSGTSSAATRLGASFVSRTGSATTQFYRDGAAVGANAAQGSSAIQAEAVLIGRLAGNYDTTDRIAAVCMGSGLNATEALALHTRIETFLTAINAATVPYNTALPAISGTTESGQTLSCTTGTWAKSPSSYAYQWTRDGVGIGGATSSTFALTGTDVGTTIACKVTATNGNGSGLVATATGVGPITAGASYDADSLVFFGAMATDPGATRKGHYDTLIVGLKADGLWSKIDALYIFAAHEESTGLLNLKARAYDGSNVNTATFTTDRGYTFSGTAYIDSNFNPTTAGSPQFVQDSCHAYGYINQCVSSTLSGNSAVFGQSVSSGNMIMCRPRNASNNLEGRASSTTVISGAVADRLGGSTSTRTASNAAAVYRNGSSIGTIAVASAGMANSNIFAGRFGTTYNTNDRIATMCIGSGLDATQASNLHSRITTFLTAIGAN